MIRCKRSIPKRFSRSQAKMGRGSSLCEQLSEKIDQQFKNNVSQCSFARNLGFSSSSIQNIIQRFTESGELSRLKQHGQHEIQHWAHAHLKLTDAKWESVLWSDESTFQIVFGNYGHPKEEKDKSRLLPAQVQKPASVMLSGVC